MSRQTAACSGVGIGVVTRWWSATSWSFRTHASSISGESRSGAPTAANWSAQGTEDGFGVGAVEAGAGRAAGAVGVHPSSWSSARSALTRFCFARLRFSAPLNSTLRGKGFRLRWALPGPARPIGGPLGNRGLFTRLPRALSRDP